MSLPAAAPAAAPAVCPVAESPFAVAPARPLADPLPLDLQQQLRELEQWALANKKDARNDAIAFWSLKTPAILTSAGAGLLAHFGQPTVSLWAGALATLCVLIDGVHPRGVLRNIHLSAYHDIRLLSTTMMSQWRSRKIDANNEKVAREIIREAEKERRRIATYIRNAESAPNPRIKL
jgi:hypothetical protein